MECRWQGPRHGRLEGNRECSACDRDALRPDIVLFGEAPRHLRQIEVELEKCDLFVAIGTSGTVYPAAGFVEIAKANCAKTHRFNINLDGGSDHFNTCSLGVASQTVTEWVNEVVLAV